MNTNPTVLTALSDAAVALVTDTSNPVAISNLRGAISAVVDETPPVALRTAVKAFGVWAGSRPHHNANVAKLNQSLREIEFAERPVAIGGH